MYLLWTDIFLTGLKHWKCLIKKQNGIRSINVQANPGNSENITCNNVIWRLWKKVPLWELPLTSQLFMACVFLFTPFLLPCVYIAPPVGWSVWGPAGTENTGGTWRESREWTWQPSSHGTTVKCLNLIPSIQCWEYKDQYCNISVETSQVIFHNCGLSGTVLSFDWNISELNYSRWLLQCFIELGSIRTVEIILGKNVICSIEGIWLFCLERRLVAVRFPEKMTLVCVPRLWPCVQVLQVVSLVTFRRSHGQFGTVDLQGQGLGETLQSASRSFEILNFWEEKQDQNVLWVRLFIVHSFVELLSQPDQGILNYW